MATSHQPVAEDADFAETQRVRSLVDYEILDTPPEVLFDEMARIAASVCGTPIALVSLVDGERQWFKAKIGLDASETPRNIAFCDHAIRGSEPLIVEDATADARFSSNPLVTADPHIRFYAGAPLIAPDGHALGTLCVIDRVPRQLAAEQVDALKLLSRHVMAQIELRNRVTALSQSNARRKEHIGLLRDSRERLSGLMEAQEARLERLSQYSAQTGLANRNLFLARLAEHLADTRGLSPPLTVFVLDIQRFHLVSETVGQSHLDQLLQQVAQRMIHVFDDPAQVAHLESDRFAAFKAPGQGVSAALAFVDAVLLPALCAPYSIDDRELHVAFKIGVAVAPMETLSADVLLRRAKTALLKAKESQEDSALFSADLEARVASVVSLQTRLRRAIEERQFELHYQPKVSLLDGSISSVEALIRWRDPSPDVDTADPAAAWVPPARFVPALEANGQIVEVGRWALEQAASDYADWRRRGVAAPRIAVNISPLQLRHRSFLLDVRAVLAKHAPDAGIDIELTEAVLMEQPEQCIESLHLLRQWGIRVAIDDFGSGYSSLRYIAKLPLDILKIDMAFIHDMPKSPDNMAIVSSVISLAHGLRLKTVAEGVETEEQRNLLRLLRCDEIQGYLCSRPLPKLQLEELLARGTSSRPQAAAVSAAMPPPDPRA